MAPETIGNENEGLPQVHNPQVEDTTSAVGYSGVPDDANTANKGWKIPMEAYKARMKRIMAYNRQVKDATSAVGDSGAPEDANKANEYWKLRMETYNGNMTPSNGMIDEPPTNIGGESLPALSITFPNFNPEGVGADALAWCRLVDICLGEYQLQDDALIVALSKSLQGSALSWLLQVMYEGMTWSEFKVNFLACYGSENTCAATMISINNSRPKEDESYAAYASRLVDSFVTRWKALTPEQIAISFVLAHISQFDSRVQRMAHTTEITTREKLVQELKGFSNLKHKLRLNPDENIDLTPEKRIKSSVPIQRPARKRKGTKTKTATATSSKPAEVIEIGLCCGEEGQKATYCPKTSASALSEPGPSRETLIEHRRLDTNEHGCVCCGPQPVIGTLRQSEKIRHTAMPAGSFSVDSNNTICIEDNENKNCNIDQSNVEKKAPPISHPGSSSTASNNTIYIEIDTEENKNLNQSNEENNSTEKYAEDINQNVIQRDVENKSSDVYTELVLLEQRALVPNNEEIECGICIDNYQPGQGVVLRECLHTFCKECLSDVVKHSEEPAVTCPAMGCPELLQQREIRALVSPDDYERWLAKGLAAAESGTRNAFHCQTHDCQGWAMCDPGVTRFHCPVCNIVNCVACKAIHEGETCNEYRARQNSDKKTETYLEKILSRREAMKCPKCSVIITKQVGCDWIKCAACKTEICWATRGPRWGPRGRGDTSGGCRCNFNRKKCHPSCQNCH